MLVWQTVFTALLIIIYSLDGWTNTNDKSWWKQFNVSLSQNQKNYGCFWALCSLNLGKTWQYCRSLEDFCSQNIYFILKCHEENMYVFPIRKSTHHVRLRRTNNDISISYFCFFFIKKMYFFILTTVSANFSYFTVRPLKAGKPESGFGSLGTKSIINCNDGKSLLK